MRTFVVIACTAAMCSNAAAQTTVAGFTPGSFRVTESGAAEYRIAIRVPPGVAGMEPRLALAYNSQAGNGLAGVGWSLQGLSAITRCPRTMAQDGARGTILYDTNDRFCMDGQRLMAVSGDYGVELTEYRTEIESFSKVVSYGTAGTGPAWFRVWTKAGQVLEYGNTDDSQIKAQGKDSVRVWAVNKISDTKGNYIAFSYLEDEPNGQYVVDRIDYTGNTGAGLSPGASVRFSYEARTDTSIGYRGGSMVKSTQRLTNVKTYHGETLVTDYRLAYEYGAATGRSRLLSVTECAGAAGASCLPPRAFTWRAGPMGFAANSSYTAPDVVHNYDSNPSTMLRGQFVDLDGDGLADWVRAFRNSSGTKYQSTWMNTGSGWQGDAAYALPDVITDYNYDPPHTRGQFVDVNGDGLPDWVTAYRLPNQTNVRTTWVNTGQGWQAEPSYDPPDSINDYNYDPPHTRGQFVDVNGDGLPDWVQAYRLPNQTNLRTTYLNTGGGWQVDSAYQLPDSIIDYNYNPPHTRGQFVDLNGDGLPDWVRAYRFPDGTNYRTTWLNTGNGWLDTPAYVLPDSIIDYKKDPPNVRGQFVDVNGDGLPDWVTAYRLANGDNLRNTWLNTGAGWQYDSAYNLPDSITDYNYDPEHTRGQFVDVNGDGLLDWLRAYRLPSDVQYQETWLNTGSGWLNVSAFAMPDSINDYGSTPATLIRGRFADVNGDGILDWVRAFRNSGGTDYKYTWTASAYQDVIETMPSGAQGSLTVTYKPLTDGTIHTKDSGGLYPVQNLQPPLHVVATVARSDGIGGSVSTDQTYGGLKAEVGGGRGFLGFRWMETEDHATGVTLRTEYSQSWPYIGMAMLVQSMQASGGILKKATTSFDCADPQTGGSCTVAAGNRYFPHVSQSVEEESDLNGAALPTVTTTMHYDLYGNAESVVVSTGDGYSKTTTNVFANDVVNWLLGRLTRSTVQSTTP